MYEPVERAPGLPQYLVDLGHCLVQVTVVQTLAFHQRERRQRRRREFRLLDNQRRSAATCAPLV